MEFSRVYKQLLGTALLVCLLVSGVSAQSLTFQDITDINSVLTSIYTYSGHYSAGGSVDWVNNSGSGGNSYIQSQGSSWCGGVPMAFILNKEKQPMTYSAATWIYSAASWGHMTGVKIKFYDVGGFEQGTPLDIEYNVSAPYGALPQRVEIKVLGGTAYAYVNGIEVTHQATNAYTDARKVPMNLNPYYIGWSGLAKGQHCTYSFTTHFDDMVWGDAENKYVFGFQPSYFFLQKDVINPAASALMNEAGRPVNSLTMTSSWAKPNDDNITINLINKDSGAVLSSFATTKRAGTYTWNLSGVFFNNPNAKYGQYVITSTGTAYESTPLPYVGGGGIIHWDADMYATGDTATIAWEFAEGGYWNPANYQYWIDIMGPNGIVQTTGINQQKGGMTYKFGDTATVGIYYAILKMKPLSGGDDIWVYWDPAEVQNYVYLRGYVMDAETGRILPNATLNVTQGTRYKVSTSSLTGYNSSNNWLIGSEMRVTTNLAGYTSDVRSFTPLVGKTIALNISLLSTTPTYKGIAVGGVVRDSVYGNPVSAATYYVRNQSAEYFNTTNIAGYAFVDHLSSNTLYDVWSTKVGYNNSAVEHKYAVAGGS